MLTERLFGYAGTEVIDDDLTQAGFTDAVYTALDLPFTAKSAQEVAIGFCMGTDLRVDIEERAAGDVSHATETVASSLRKKFGTGEINSTIRVNIVSASG